MFTMVFCNLFSVCNYMYTLGDAYIHVDVLVSVCTQGGQRSKLTTFCLSPAYILQQHFSLTLELTGSTRLAGQ